MSGSKYLPISSLTFPGTLTPTLYLAILFCFVTPRTSSILIEPQLLELSSSSVFITMSNTTGPIRDKVNSLTFRTDDDKAFAMVEALKAHSLLSQQDLAQFLTLAGVQFTPFWISNQIHVKDAFPELVFALFNLFPGKISQISQELVLPMLPTFDEAEIVKPTEDTSTEWGIKSMGAPDVWRQGMTGQGVTVGVLDTGCLVTHEQFAGKSISWFDAMTPVSSLGAHDNNGHGSHVCGTIAGKTVGMAPAANLLVCKCCDTAGCTEVALNQCGQHITCPDPPSCKMRPQVVSCSWGGSGGSTFYKDVISTWRSLNMFPVFALGNSGPECKTAGSPGDNPNVVGVAAMDETKKIGSFSSRGPALNPTGNLKPQLTGPGVKINSCSNLSPTGYKQLSGTSMATPHISGLAALLLSNNKKLSYDQLLSAMIASCSKDLQPTGVTCGGTSDAVFPNFVFGHGKPSASKAIQILQQQQQKSNAKKESESTAFNDFETSEEENNAAENFADFDESLESSSSEEDD